MSDPFSQSDTELTRDSVLDPCLGRLPEALRSQNKQFRPAKKQLESALGRPEGASKTGFNALGGQKSSPGGSQIEVQTRFELKVANSKKTQDVSYENLIFKAPGSHFGAQNGVQNWV